jgi:predicted CoA-binding protein
MIKEKPVTLVLGASENTSRYSNIATQRLLEAGHKVALVGKSEGVVRGIPIHTFLPVHEQIDTVTMYLNPQNQQKWYEELLALNPRRIIFNPGTENPELEALAREKGILVTEACTLVLLSLNQYQNE